MLPAGTMPDGSRLVAGTLRYATDDAGRILDNLLDDARRRELNVTAGYANMRVTMGIPDAPTTARGISTTGSSSPTTANPTTNSSESATGRLTGTRARCEQIGPPVQPHSANGRPHSAFPGTLSYAKTAESCRFAASDRHDRPTVHSANVRFHSVRAVSCEHEYEHEHGADRAQGSAD